MAFFSGVLTWGLQELVELRPCSDLVWEQGINFLSNANASKAAS